MRRMSRRVRRAARRAARRVAAPMLERAAAPGREVGQQALLQVEALDRSLSSIRADSTEWELERGDLRAGLINIDLLKGEIRTLGAVLEELGRAIAPSFGLSEAATALAELRERVTACERRLRFLEAGGHQHERGFPTAEPAGNAPASTLFDYAGFERRFRGRPEDVVATLDERYGALLGAHGPVLDIGCGRAELIGLLGQRGREGDRCRL